MLFTESELSYCQIKTFSSYFRRGDYVMFDRLITAYNKHCDSLRAKKTEVK